VSDLEQALNYVSGAFRPNEHAVTLARRVAELEAALRPFAKDAQAFDGAERTYGDGPFFRRVSGDYGWQATIADVRRARAALADDGGGAT
jgi:hypothetical protein